MMDVQLIGRWEWLVFIILWVAVWVFLLKPYTTRKPTKAAPGPAPWPIVGNLFCLGAKPHKSLADLAASHGPLMTLRLGFRTTIVISSASVAREVMLHHDAAFAGRSVQDSTTVLDHHHSSVVFLPPGPRWRFLRRICTSHIFANSKVDDGRELRRKKVTQLVSYMERCSKSGKAVNMGQVVFTTILNILSNIVFSIDMADLNSNFGCEFKELIWGLMVVAGTPNIADFFPFLKLVDPQGAKRRSTILTHRVFNIFDELIERKLKMRSNISVEDKDVVDCLITINQKDDSEFGRNDILHFLLDLFGAGTDTTSSTIEWTMTELLRNPNKLMKVQAELEDIVGKGNPFEEEHLVKLPYLQAVVKETLRMHPPVPFLVPRNVEADVVLCGYSVPKNTQVLVNVWAIGRDNKTWKNPHLFEPERFQGSTMDYKGHDAELIPFGFGRRVCPGIPLASKALMLVLGSLLHSFKWTLPNGLSSSEMDMNDKFGFTLQKAEPLFVIPVNHNKYCILETDCS